MKLHFLRHNCGVSNMLQILNGKKPTNCKFYWKMRGGKTYSGNVHFFTLFGFRMVINTIKKKDLWTT
jgi:hypothetical protein